MLATDHKGQALVTLPDALGRQAFEAWVKTLPDSNSPSWIGLPVTAESQLKSHTARRVLANLALLQGGQDTDYAGALEQQSQQQQVELNNTAKLVNPWIAALPTPEQLPAVDADSLSSAASLPAERWLAREIIRGSSVVQLVRDDLLSIRFVFLINFCPYSHSQDKLLTFSGISDTAHIAREKSRRPTTCAKSSRVCARAACLLGGAPSTRCAQQ